MVDTASIPRYAIHFDSEITAAPSGTKVLKKIPAAASGPDLPLHRIRGYNRGAADATFHLEFRCVPTPNVDYDGYTSGGGSEPAGAEWLGELEIRPALKRREVTPRFNRIKSTSNLASPASIHCKVTLVARTTINQGRASLPADPRHVSECTVTFNVIS